MHATTWYLLALLNFILAFISTPKFTILGISCNTILGIVFLAVGVGTHYYKKRRIR